MVGLGVVNMKICRHFANQRGGKRGGGQFPKTYPVYDDCVVVRKILDLVPAPGTKPTFEFGFFVFFCFSFFFQGGFYAAFVVLTGNASMFGR